MGLRVFDPAKKDKAPVGLAKASKDKKWVYAGTVGEWLPIDKIKEETTVVTKEEKLSGKNILGEKL